MRRFIDWLPLSIIAIGVVLAARGYSHNDPIYFFMGVSILLSGLIVLGVIHKGFFKDKLVLINSLVGLIIFTFAFIAFEIFARATEPFQVGQNPISLYRKKMYSYAQAKNDPVAFAYWWKAYSQYWHLSQKAYTRRDPQDFYPYLVNNSSSGTFLESKFRYNNLGFRGEDQDKKKIIIPTEL